MEHVEKLEVREGGRIKYFSSFVREEREKSRNPKKQASVP